MGSKPERGITNTPWKVGTAGDCSSLERMEYYVIQSMVRAQLSLPFRVRMSGIFLFLTAVRGALGESDYSLQGSQSPVSALLFSDIPTCLLWIPFCLPIYIF